MTQRIQVKTTTQRIEIDPVTNRLAVITSGPMGSRGVQGEIGLTGPQGSQGVQGVQGNQGIQGAQGPIGSTGPVGPQGDLGPQGPVGAAGGGTQQSVWNYTGSAVAGPTINAGRVGINNDNAALATVMFIHKNDGEGAVDWTNTISVMQADDSVYVQAKADATSWHRWIVTDVPTLNSGTTWAIPIVHDAGSAQGTEPANNADILVAFQFQPIQGPVGPAGPTGPQGPTGDTGSQGIQGVPGAAGPQGIQGIQGTPGAGFPAGGLTDQILAKASSTNYDTEWIDAPTGGGGGGVVGFNRRTADYHPVLLDKDKMIEMNLGVSNVVTIDNDATLGLVATNMIHIRQFGTGSTRIVAGSGVTIKSRPGLILIGKDSVCTLIHDTEANTWNIFGDLWVGGPTCNIFPSVTLTGTSWGIPALTTGDGTWSGAVSYTYQWQERVANTSGSFSNSISVGSTTATYTGTVAGKAYRCRVTAADSSGNTTSVYSDVVEIVGVGLSQTLTALSTIGYWLLCGAEGAINAVAGSPRPGRGEKRTFSLPHTLSESIQINVGSAAVMNTPGTNGGGIVLDTAAGAGGGSCDIRIGGTALANRKAVAAGGGGVGANNGTGFTTGQGGDGGGTTGVAGLAGTGTTGGGGGTQIAGGTSSGSGSATAGSLGQGGTGGGVNPRGGGGGGSGYYGGGGGGGTPTPGNSGAGGGGGSGYSDPAATTVVSTQGHRSGDSVAAVVWASTGVAA